MGVSLAGRSQARGSLLFARDCSIDRGGEGGTGLRRVTLVWEGALVLLGEDVFYAGISGVGARRIGEEKRNVGCFRSWTGGKESKGARKDDQTLILRRNEGLRHNDQDEERRGRKKDYVEAVIPIEFLSKGR